MNTIKVLISGFLLLAVFSLPTLTATQLVGVLGEAEVAKPLQFDLLRTPGVFAKIVGSKLTVSYLGKGIYQVLKVTNPNPASRVFRISLGRGSDETLTGEVVTLQAGSASYRLYDHSNNPFNQSYDIVVPVLRPLNLSLIVKSDPGIEAHGTIEISLEEF